MPDSSDLTKGPLSRRTLLERAAGAALLVDWRWRMSPVPNFSVASAEAGGQGGQVRRKRPWVPAFAE